MSGLAVFYRFDLQGAGFSQSRCAIHLPPFIGEGKHHKPEKEEQVAHLKPNTTDYLVRYADRETGEIFERIEHLKFNQTVSQLYSAYEYFGWYVIEIKEIEGE